MPSTLSRQTASQPFVAISSAGLKNCPPALLTTTSSPPAAASAAADERTGRFGIALRRRTIAARRRREPRADQRAAPVEHSLAATGDRYRRAAAGELQRRLTAQAGSAARDQRGLPGKYSGANDPALGARGHARMICSRTRRRRIALALRRPDALRFTRVPPSRGAFAATLIDYLIWRVSAGSGLQLLGLVERPAAAAAADPRRWRSRSRRSHAAPRTAPSPRTCQRPARTSGSRRPGSPRPEKHGERLAA